MGYTSQPGETDGFDTWTALKLITQDTRASLISDIVGHPEGMPSVPELDYTNPNIGRSAIEGHLRKLTDAGVVEAVEFPKGERRRDLPYKFYRITPEARELFDRNNLFSEDVWRETYAKVKKTPEIREIESMPRPVENA
ncbi:helix-turn-helix domain-containing protein [Haladaptatus sp. YSMS36]|uniref:helix-turn-helix domain-containing protein n=1 Tax=Haladaptatus sp. YSMS36 TaxID=3033384 RepID=UPI0023E8B7EC|nr:helix-turn-helix domain-containing protein [Haladaptatus sp. YSMS36]